MACTLSSSAKLLDAALLAHEEGDLAYAGVWHHLDYVACHDVAHEVLGGFRIIASMVRLPNRLVSKHFRKEY